MVNQSKPKLHVVSFSGGKDSTAMLLRMIEEGYPVDIILFCDTGLEFPELLEHVDKVEKYISRPIIRLKSDKDFMYWAVEYPHVMKNGRKKIGYGYPTPFTRYCTRELKTNVISRYLRELRKDYEVIQYIGIAADESKRKRDLNYPLIDWGMTETDCLKYCYDRGFDWGGLYEIWDRVSCWCCPLQSMDSLRKLKLYRPELWDKLRDIDKAINEYPRAQRNNYQFTKSFTDIERRFEVEDEFIAQGKKIRTKEFYQTLRDRGINY